MFVKIKKVTTEVKRDAQGNVVKNPTSNNSPITEINVVEEFIRIDEIKSFRDWKKDAVQKSSVKGPMTLIYMKGTKEKNSQGKTATILVAEDFNTLGQRLGSVNEQ